MSEIQVRSTVIFEVAGQIKTKGYPYTTTALSLRSVWIKFKIWNSMMV